MPLYALPDEPRPGALQRLAVQPFWPLLAVMAAGPWLSWPWFALNGHAVGSPTRWRETGVALLGFVGTAVLFVAVLAAFGSGVVGRGTQLQLALLVLVIWKLGVTYWLMVLQAPGVELFRYYRGAVGNALPVVIGGFLVDRWLARHLPDVVRILIG